MARIAHARMLLGALLCATLVLAANDASVAAVREDPSSTTPSQIEQPQNTLSDLDALRYVASHPDLIRAFGANADRGRAHYAQYSLIEGRGITFDPIAYLAGYPDLLAAFGSDALRATRHYIEWGSREGRSPNNFDALNYIASYGDLIRAFGLDAARATRHYVEWGFREGRKLTFDALAYIASYGDLIRAFGTDVVAGTRHFILWGFNEGRTTLFNATRYLARYADLQVAFGSDTVAATKHYIVYGFNEGRSFATSFLVTATASTGGSINPRSVNVDQGGRTSFTVTPDSGYEIQSVSGCIGTLAGNTFTTGVIDQACTVSATFKVVAASFSIGGSASGLSLGDTLILQLENERLTVTGNSTFAFSARFPSGYRYTVVVASAPSGKSCSITNPTGLVSGNVTSIAVVCTLSTPSPSVSPAGIWEFDSRDAQGAIAVVTSDGQFQVQFSEDAALGRSVPTCYLTHYWGVLSLSGTTVRSSTLQVADSCNSNTEADVYKGTVVVSGSFVPQQSLTLTFTFTPSPTCPASRCTQRRTWTGLFRFDPRYRRPGTLDRVAYNWRHPRTGQFWNINESGVIFMQDFRTGCTVNGQVSIADPQYNIYVASYFFDNCLSPFANRNGTTASGLLFVDDVDIDPSPSIYIQVNSAFAPTPYGLSLKAYNNYFGS